MVLSPAAYLVIALVLISAILLLTRRGRSFLFGDPSLFETTSLLPSRSLDQDRPVPQPSFHIQTTTEEDQPLDPKSFQLLLLLVLAGVSAGLLYIRENRRA